MHEQRDLVAWSEIGRRERPQQWHRPDRFTYRLPATAREVPGMGTVVMTVPGAYWEVVGPAQVVRDAIEVPLAPIKACTLAAHGPKLVLEGGELV